jgi:hypothetical protein
MTFMHQRVRQDEVTVAHEPAAAPAWARPDPGGTWHRVTLRRDGRKMTVLFRCSPEAVPSAADVLDCLASDAAGAGQPFRDWCADYGDDIHSGAARARYQRVQDRAAKLRAFLGEAYDAYVWNTDC